MAFPLLALLLLAQDAPVATAKAHAPAPAAAPVAAAADRDVLPQGAPAGDYEFVAWCDGVLAGHMDIAERVKDVLPIDDVQQKIGKAYLRAYVRALDGSPDGKTAEGHARAEAARQDGFNKWDQARAADHKLAAETYLAYQLPPRCEHAAQRLSHNPNLFKLAPSVDDVGAIQTAATRVADPGAVAIAPGSAPFSMARKPVATPVSAAVAAPAIAPIQAAVVPASAGAGAAVMPSDAPAATAEVSAPPAPIMAPAAAVTPKAEAKPAADKPAVKKPKRGHLLPPFLRKKDADEE